MTGIDFPPHLEGTIGIYGTPISPIGNGGVGLDLELGLARVPVTLGAMAMLNIPGLAPQGLLYVRTMPVDDPAPTQWGLLVGGGWTWTGYNCTGFGACFTGAGIGPPGFVVGAAYQWRWANQWLRIQPNMMLIPSYGRYQPAPITTFVMGPAWIEYGYQFGRNFEVSLRASLSPLRLAWRF